MQKEKMIKWTVASLMLAPRLRSTVAHVRGSRKTQASLSVEPEARAHGTVRGAASSSSSSRSSAHYAHLTQNEDPERIEEQSIPSSVEIAANGRPLALLQGERVLSKESTTTGSSSSSLLYTKVSENPGSDSTSDPDLDAHDANSDPDTRKKKTDGEIVDEATESSNVLTINPRQEDHWINWTQANATFRYVHPFLSAAADGSTESDPHAVAAADMNADTSAKETLEAAMTDLDEHIWEALLPKDWSISRVRVVIPKIPAWSKFTVRVNGTDCPDFIDNPYQFMTGLDNTIERVCKLVGNRFHVVQRIPNHHQIGKNPMELFEFQVFGHEGIEISHAGYPCQCSDGLPYQKLGRNFCSKNHREWCESCKVGKILSFGSCHEWELKAAVVKKMTDKVTLVICGVVFGIICLIGGVYLVTPPNKYKKIEGVVETDPEIKPPAEEADRWEEGDHTKWEEDEGRWNDGYYQAAAMTGTTASQGAADARRVVDGTLDIGSSVVSGTGKLLYGAADLTGQAVMGTASVVSDVATGTANVAATGAMYTGSAVVSGTSAAVDATGSALMYTGGAVVGATTAVGGAAIDGTMAVGGAAISGTKYVGGAVVDGTSAVVDGTGSAIMYTGGAVAGGVGAVGDRWDERRRIRSGERGGSGKEFPEKSASKKGTKKGGFVASGGKGVKGKGPKKGAAE